MRCLIVALMLIFSSCCSVPPQVGPRYDPSACPAACRNLRAHGCEAGEDLLDGTTCEEFCTETVLNGHDLRPWCMAKAASCAAADRCSAGN
jgi:hypothetical protein